MSDLLPGIEEKHCEAINSQPHYPNPLDALGMPYPGSEQGLQALSEKFSRLSLQNQCLGKKIENCTYLIHRLKKSFETARKNQKDEVVKQFIEDFERFVK